MINKIAVIEAGKVREYTVGRSKLTNEAVLTNSINFIREIGTHYSKKQEVYYNIINNTGNVTLSLMPREGSIEFL